MRKLYWYLTAYIKKHGLVVIASVLGAVLVFSFTVPTLVTTIEKSKRQYVGVVGTYSLEKLPPRIAAQLSAGLTQIEEDGSTVPALSERWTIENDGKTYRFAIKENIYWQDGKVLEPQDIPYKLSGVETIVTPNDIVFKLPDAYAPFPNVVSQPIFRVTNEKYHFFFTRPTLIGIGKYHISDYSTDSRKNLKQLIIDGENERFIYRFYSTEDAAVQALKHGAIDTIFDLSKPYDVFEWDTMKISESLDTSHYLGVFFNMRDPILDKNIRQALSYALEKPTGEIRAIGPLNPKSWAYFSGGKTYDKSLERASERLLATIPPFPLNLTLTTTSLFENTAEQIKQEWEEFGAVAYEDCKNASAITDKAECEKLKITVQIKITNFPDTSNFQVLLIGQEIPPDPDQYQLWHSEQPTNFTGYKNTRIDNLLEKGRQTFNTQERTEIYQEFQQFFLEDAPAVFLNYLTNYSITRK